MKASFAALVLSSFVAQQAAATGFGWTDAKCFSNPSNSDNQCSKQQKGGYNWGNVPTGSFSSYDGFDFSGFSCKDSFGGGHSKRDQVR